MFSGLENGDRFGLIKDIFDNLENDPTIREKYKNEGKPIAFGM